MLDKVHCDEKWNRNERAPDSRGARGLTGPESDQAVRRAAPFLPGYGHYLVSGRIFYANGCFALTGGG